ncbi:MAG: hypothetical protein MUP67_08370 [Acidimicrobiia bacterium]|nr:hypothetical protein [Acidimicrobiia bacterium]
MPDNDDLLAPPTPEPPTETRHSFGEHMEEIRSDVIQLAGLTGEAIGAGTEALLAADLKAVERLIGNDTRIDSLKESIEFRVY